jgi:hypothetical protein
MEHGSVNVMHATRLPRLPKPVRRGLLAVMLAAVMTMAAIVPAHAEDFTLWLNSRDSDGSWYGWYALGDNSGVPGGIQTMFIVNDNFNDTVHLDNYSANGTLWDNVFSYGVWQGWEQAPSAPNGTVMMRAAGLPDGDIAYLAANNNGWMYESTRSSAGPWSSWSAEFKIPELGDFAATADANGNVQIILSAIGGVVYHNMQFTDGAWQGLQQPSQIPGGDGAFDVAAAGLPDGSVQFMVYKGTGQLWHDIRYDDGTWQGWKEPLQPPSGFVTSDGTWSFGQLWGAADGLGNTQWIVSSTLNDYTASNPTQLYHTVRYADGSWQHSGWGRLQSPPPGAGACGDVSISSPTYTSGPDYSNTYVLAQCAL